MYKVVLLQLIAIKVNAQIVLQIVKYAQIRILVQHVQLILILYTAVDNVLHLPLVHKVFTETQLQLKVAYAIHVLIIVKYVQIQIHVHSVYPILI